MHPAGFSGHLAQSQSSPSSQPHAPPSPSCFTAGGSVAWEEGRRRGGCRGEAALAEGGAAPPGSQCVKDWGAFNVWAMHQTESPA